MKTGHILARSAALSLFVVSATTATAQEIIAQQDQNVVYFQIAYESPVACDDETAAGFQTWTNVGSWLQYPEYTQSYWSGYRTHNSEHTQITFQPPAYMTTGATAEVVWGNSVGSRTIDNKTIPIVDDADVIVNSDRWASRTFDCEATATAYNQFDFARVIAHEAGHVAGLGDTYSATNCAMYGSMQYGVAGTSRCSYETNQILRLYGSR